MRHWCAQSPPSYETSANDRTMKSSRLSCESLLAQTLLDRVRVFDDPRSIFKALCLSLIWVPLVGAGDPPRQAQGSLLSFW